MTRSACWKWALVGALLALPAGAQVQVTVTLPTLRFEAQPALVVVEPGIQVVPDYDEEVFFVSGWYWHRRGEHWFKAKDHRGGWVAVERGVPPGLARIPPGKYRHFRAPEHRASPVGPIFTGEGHGGEGKFKGGGGDRGKHGGGKKH